MKPLPKLLVKLLWLLAPLVMVFVILELNLPKVTNSYNKKHRDFEAQLSTTEILILGNSHAIKGINPKLLGTYCYNLANVSQSLFYDSKLALCYIDRMPRLKTVIIPVSYYSLYTELSQTSEYWRDGYYMRFWNIRHPDFNPGIEQRSLTALYTPKDALKYAWRGFNIDLVPEINEQGFQHTDTVNHHYSAATGRERVAFHHSIMKQENLAKNLAYLDTLLTALHSKNIRVVLLTLPVNQTYYDNINQQTFDTIKKHLEALGLKYGYPYLCHLDPTGFTASDFLDDDHLNMRGAAKMSRIIFSEINKE